MRVFESLEEARAAELRRPVVTLGVFDGVHVGHRLVIDNVVTLARERTGDAVVVTFARHPKAVIEHRAPKLITSLRHRLRIFEELGVTATLVLRFDDALRNMTAPKFAREVLGDVLGAEVVVLGYNNRFGKDREGDISVLENVGDEAGFEARQVEGIRLGEQPVSSTEIRHAILAGDLDRAALMLGRPVSVLGTVERGDGIGTDLGFPTANLDIHHEVRPPPGVYGCEAILDGEKLFGLVNIGVRPTVTDRPATGATQSAWEIRDRDERVEVHLLDFSGDIYGRDVEVLFLIRIRAERRFDGLDALRAQIGRDREVFATWLDGVGDGR